MTPRNLAPWLRIVVAALIVALGSGVGLPGIVRAMVPAQQHVCTCASAGSGAGHESCPVCSGAQTSRPRHAHVTGVPCGERVLGVGFACEPALVQASPWIVTASFQRAEATRDVALAPGALSAETPTPPPRRVSA